VPFDPSENPQCGRTRAAFDGWAEYHDLVAGDRTAMRDFYCGLVEPQTRSLIELGCGTGTIILSLAARARERRGGFGSGLIVGLDKSAEMLRIARRRDPGVQWVLGDMRAPPICGGFDLAICCYNTVQSVLHDDELVEFFRSVRSILAPGGVFAFDVVQPQLPSLNLPAARRRIADENGRCFEHHRSYCYDPQSRILALDHRLFRCEPVAVVELAHINFQYRQFHVAELEHALACAGLAIQWRYGDFDKSPLTASSDKQLFVCSPAPGEN
jgi:SAM-dependent methyltransferase